MTTVGKIPGIFKSVLLKLKEYIYLNIILPYLILLKSSVNDGYC